MADRYIDKDETQIYGPYAVQKIRKVCIGLVPEFDAALEHMAQEIEHATGALGQLIAAGRDADAVIRADARAKGPALKAARDLLGRFGRHLDAHPAGKIDRKLYFVGDGTVRGVGTSAARVLLAVSHVATMLGRKDCPVMQAAEWQKEMQQAALELAPLIEHSDGAKTDRSTTTPEIEAARGAWLQVYRAAKCTAEAVLRLTGKLGVMPRVFFDLAVPAGAKVTEAPVEANEPSPAAVDT